MTGADSRCVATHPACSSTAFLMFAIRALTLLPSQRDRALSTSCLRRQRPLLACIESQCWTSRNVIGVMQRHSRFEGVAVNANQIPSLIAPVPPLNWQRLLSCEDNSDDSVSLLFILSGVGSQTRPGTPYMSSTRHDWAIRHSIGSFAPHEHF